MKDSTIITIKKDFVIPERFMNVLVERASSDRARAESRGARKDLTVFAYAPFTKHHFALMVSKTVMWAGGQSRPEKADDYLNGMITGWFVGYSASEHRDSDLNYKGYPYNEGRQRGSALFHFLESETLLFRIKNGEERSHPAYERIEPCIPKYLHIDFDKYIVNNGDIWHRPGHCDECDQLLDEEKRIIGQVDGDKEDADYRFACGLDKRMLRDLAQEKRFIREDAGRAVKWDEAWEFFFDKKPSWNPYRAKKSRS